MDVSSSAVVSRVPVPASKADSATQRDILMIAYADPQGGLTELTNLTTVARQLRADPEGLLDFFHRRLGVPVVRNGTALRGVFSQACLERVLEKYIGLHVLCSVCERPEVDSRRVGPSGVVRGRCGNCGGLPAVALD